MLYIFIIVKIYEYCENPFKVKTGEEDDEIVFSNRAKLYRWNDAQWKERGLGDMKILKNKEGRARIVMRREQVLKICANHFIQAEMSLLAMNEKAWIWTAMDASDETRNGTAVLEKFAVRFKEVDTAKDFEKVFNESKVVKKQEVPEKKKESPKPSGKFSFGFNFEKEEEKSIEEAKKTLEEEDLEKALAEEEKSMEEETKATTTGWFSAV